MSNPSRVPSSGARWCAAVICLIYGFAKINGSQFTVLDSQLTKPMGEVSGFWLTWYFFSYSKVYGTTVALVQIIGGALLIVPRTALLAALVLLPVVVNIVLIDIFYGIDPGALGMALVLLGCLTAVIVPSLPALRSIVLPEIFAWRPTNAALAGLVIATGSAYAVTHWIANSNNRAPTAIDGTWRAERRGGRDSSTTSWPEVVFFEYNRAYMAVFRRQGAPDTTHHFELDSTGTIRIWTAWLRKDSLLMSGRRTSTDMIVLQRAGGADTNRLVLRRVARPGAVALRTAPHD